MASSTSNSRINIYINNDEAKRKLIDLDESFRKNAESLRRLAAAGQQNTQAAKDLQKEQAKLTTQMNETRREAGLHALSYKELRGEYTSLLNQFNRAIPGSEHRRALGEQLRVVRARLNEVEGSARRCSSTFSRMAGTFNKYFAVLGAAVAGITGLTLKFRQLAQDVAKLDDTYSDVMKTTGMTRDEVVLLNESLKRMDTRTTREELNLLARDAGKLGISGKKNILDFVEAGNQIRVALGEDLGDDAIKNIGKMVDVFALSTKELDGLDLKGKMLAVGSAINELGQSSTASEAYMVGFAQRLGGVASQAGVSIQNVLGFASALDQSGQAVEMSATALSKFIMKLYEEPAQFAKLAGLEVSSFTKLLREDANGAIKLTLTSLSERGGFEQLVPVFQQLGLDGARAVGVLSALATNIDKVTTAQEIANRAFTAGTSITSEYNTKNSNLQARLEKAKKEFTEVSLQLGERLNPVLLKSTNLLTYLVRALALLPDVIKKYGGAIVTATVGIIAYTIATRGASIATSLLNSAVVKLTKALFSNPWTAVIAGLALLVQWIYRVATASTAAEDAYKEFAAETAKEQASANTLFNALNDVNTSQERRKELIGEINNRYGQYLDNLLTEKSSIDEIRAAQEKVNTSLSESIALKVQGKKIEEVTAEGLDAQMEVLNKMRKKASREIGKDNANLLVSQFKKIVDDGLLQYTPTKKFQDFGEEARNLFSSFGASIQAYAGSIGKYNKSVKETKSAIKSIKEEFAAFVPKEQGGSPAASPAASPAKKPSNDAYKSTYEAELKALKQHQEKRLMELKEAHAKEEGMDEAHGRSLAALELVFLTEELALQKKHGEDTTKTRMGIADKTIANNKALFSKELKDVDKHLAAWQLHEKEALEAGEITEEEYHRSSILSELASLEEKLALSKAHGQDTLTLEQQIVDKRMAIAKRGYDDALKEQQAAHQKEVAELQKQRDSNEISEEFYQQRLLAIALDGLQERLAIDKAAGKDTSGIEKEIAQKTAASVKSLAAIRKKLLKSELEERRDMELQFLEDSHKAGLLSDKKYAQKSLAVWSKYASDKAKEVGDIATNVIQPIGAAVKAFEEAEVADNNLRREQELAKVTEDYNQKMLLAEGDAEAQQRIKEEFAAEKERIDYEAAQANLDTQKKYADANFAIQATQAVITGIISAMQAFSALASIPIVGPALGAVAAAAVAVTTAMQIAALNKERQRIKSITLEAPSSSASSSKTETPDISTQRTITPEAYDENNVVKGYAGGKYDVVSESDGKAYRAPLVRSVTGVVRRPTLVAEEPELVVGVRDFGYLQRHINYPLVLEAIGDARRRRTVPARAEGDYAAIDGSGSAATYQHSAPPQLLSLIEKTEHTLVALRGTLSEIQQNGVHANIGVTELEAQQRRLENARKSART
jgi:TP901 family phage tail tape measure protein